MSDFLIPYQCRVIGDSDEKEFEHHELWGRFDAQTYEEAAEKCALEYDASMDGYISSGNFVIVQVNLWNPGVEAKPITYRVTGQCIPIYTAEEYQEEEA